LGWVGVEVARLAVSDRFGSELASESLLMHEDYPNGSIASSVLRPLIFRFISPGVVSYRGIDQSLIV
jgi:hypothetical protein